jgi:hypothetical protein
MYARLFHVKLDLTNDGCLVDISCDPTQFSVERHRVRSGSGVFVRYMPLQSAGKRSRTVISAEMQFY